MATRATNSGQAHLWLSADQNEGVAAVALPWLRTQAAQAWRSRRPTVVIVPSRAYGFYLHSRVVEAGFNLAAIHFWTPSDARMNLLKLFPGLKPTPSRPILNALAALAAEEVHRRDSENRTAQAILAEPSSFLKTVDQLAGAGWDLADVADAPLAAVVRRWRALLREQGFQTVQELDQELIARAGANEKKIETVLVAGFDGACWTEWPILQATVTCALSAEIILPAPKLGWEDADQAWVGTWEEIFGAARPATERHGSDGDVEEKPKPFLPLQSSLHTHATKIKGDWSSVNFLLGKNIGGEAAAIAAAAIRQLQSPDCQRLGIVFPGPCPLAREVGAWLDRFEVPVDDSLGFLQPGSFEQGEWRAWLDFQQSPGIASFLGLLEYISPENILPESVTGAARTLARSAIERALRDAFRQVLIDDLAVLTAWLEQAKVARNPAIIEFIRHLSPLPESASWRDFVEKTKLLLQRLGWTERQQRIEWAASETAFLSDVTVSRVVFLRWLNEVAVSTQKGRYAEGNHRYSHVHLLGYGEAEKQQWTHLILTSLSEGVWPPPGSESGFLSRSEVTRLNRSIRRLNTATSREGRQGEGHVSMEAGKGLCLGGLERRLLAESQTLALLENVSEGLTLTARLGEEKAAGQPLAPSEFFSRLYQLITKRPLNEAEAEKLCRASLAGVDSLRAKFKSDVSLDSSDVAQTRRAFDARRAEDQPFGEYEFSWRTPPPEPQFLSCGDWESALKAPAVMWMLKYLKVAPAEPFDAESYYLPARGTWAHAWLAANGFPRSNQFVEWPEPGHSAVRLELQADQSLTEMERLLRSCGRPIPIWWTSLWQEARFLARELAAGLTPARDWPGFSTEYKLARTACDFSGGQLPPLQLGGIIDLLLAWVMPDEAGKLPTELWLVDFKTGGAARALSPSELLRGNGVQLALYALALRQLGAKEVRASLLRPGELLREQMALDKIDGFQESWLELQRMQVTGCFGAWGELRSEYRHAKSYPLATLPIDSELLEDKWAQTHPAWSGVV